MNTGGVRTLRLRRPEAVKPVPKAAGRHEGILQDQIRRSQRPPWCPSFSLAVRIILLIRVSGAMYSNITDCDEVYNFWEPLHYLDRGYGFQTWEVSPQYAIRSWAYIAMHLYPATVLTKFLSLDKRASFFTLRIVFALVSTLCEAYLYRTIKERVNFRVGRYFLFICLFSAGMWNASTAFLSSSFAMYMNTLAFAYTLQPPSSENSRRTLGATVLFATGAIVGWPFALAVAIPFVFEELFVRGLDRVTPDKTVAWFIARAIRLIVAGLCAALVFIPVVGIDSFAYGRLTIVPWDIVKYNIFGGSSRGPDLYGTESWHYYLYNLLLNFNIITPLAFLSLPALGVTYLVDRKRLGGPTKTITPAGAEKQAPQSSPFTLLALRLSPFYLWFAILTAQAHKEERFMFPIYTILAFNAAVTIYLIRGWVEVAFIKATKSPYQASKSRLFRLTTFSIMSFSIFLSISRVLALNYYYHAPLEVAHKFEMHELPRVLNVTGLLPPPPPPSPYARKDDKPPIDLSPIKELNITLCLGKEWHRFTSHWLVPDGVNVEFVKSEFDGMLPRHFVQTKEASGLWRREGTRYAPEDLNDLNKEDTRHYVDIKACHYLIDLDFPEHPSSSTQEPRYAVDTKNWERMHCVPFLDAAHSPLLTRILWLPGKWWKTMNSYGDYCLLKKKGIF